MIKIATMMPMSRDNNAITSQPRGQTSPQTDALSRDQDHAVGNRPSDRRPFLFLPILPETYK